MTETDYGIDKQSNKLMLLFSLNFKVEGVVLRGVTPAQFPGTGKFMSQSRLGKTLLEPDVCLALVSLCRW